MAQQIVPSFADSLRMLADRVEQVPGLWGVVRFPNLPQSLVVLVRSAQAVEALAVDFGVPVTTNERRDEAHTWCRIEVGLVELIVSATEPVEREPAHEAGL